MGPPLCLIYTNDINNHIGDTGKLILYTDDCTYLLSINDLERVTDGVNSDLNKLAVWYRGCKLSLNYSKTKALIFYPGTNFRPLTRDIETDEHSMEPYLKILSVY